MSTGRSSPRSRETFSAMLVGGGQQYSYTMYEDVDVDVDVDVYRMRECE